ncbi:sensor histidine kinase [Marinibaculum pumilum]|uniref:histidine kinase n=1 Tax=Marinibaculum pumilum TaxID=1766165 RepID=A0ABV7LA82_9PROT
MQQLLDAVSYMAHGYCLLWEPWLIALHAGSDIAIALAYFAIPAAIVIFLRRRPDLQFSGLAMLFAAFILFCGLTHVMSAITLWLAVYEVQGALKLATALVSVATAIVIFPLIPKALAIPSPAILQRSNEQLAAEIEAHERTLRELRAMKAELERRVHDRTAEVEEANHRLRILTREVVHRSKNLMAVIRSLAYQTAKTSDDKGDFLDKLTGRLAALADALDAVVRNQWHGAAVEDLLRGQLAHSLDTFPDRIAIAGPDLLVRPEAAQQLGLAIHELATNAVKHGALSGEAGRVRLNWRLSGGAEDPGTAFVLDWQEDWPHRPAPDRDAAATAAHGGFGTMLLERAVPTALRGRASREIGPTGMSYRLEVPLAELRPRDAKEQEERINAAFAADTA